MRDDVIDNSGSGRAPAQLAATAEGMGEQVVPTRLLPSAVIPALPSRTTARVGLTPSNHSVRGAPTFVGELGTSWVSAGTS